MSEESLAVQAEWPLGLRFRRFMIRVTTALLFTGAGVMAIIHQGDLVRDERILEHPLMVALEEVNASLLTTQLTATAVVREGAMATMEELKSLAGQIALRHGSEVEFWSDTNSAYHAVYYQGPDALGGTWTASARFLPGLFGETGKVEVSLQRDLYGKLENFRTTLHQMKGRLQRAGGIPIQDVQLDIRLQARPRPGYDPEGLIKSIMRYAGVDNPSATYDGNSWTGIGYSSRIGDFTYIGGQRVNVATRITARGQEQWIEIGSPLLR